MAFDADCGVPTVLEAFRVATTPRRLFVWRLTALATRPSVTVPRRLGAPGEGCSVGAANPKSEIRNPKSDPPPRQSSPSLSPSFSLSSCTSGSGSGAGSDEVRAAGFDLLTTLVPARIS